MYVYVSHAGRRLISSYRHEVPIPQQACDDPCLLCELFLESGKIQHDRRRMLNHLDQSI
jgi:hypothetical protein